MINRITRGSPEEAPVVQAFGSLAPSRLGLHEAVRAKSVGALNRRLRTLSTKEVATMVEALQEIDVADDDPVTSEQIPLAALLLFFISLGPFAMAAAVRIRVES